MARHQSRRKHSLKRQINTRQLRRTFVILCEGTVTEPDYLDALKRLPEVREIASVNIKVDKSRSGAVPLTLVEAAIEVKNRNDEIDEVWCLVDVEAPQPHPNLLQALSLARDNGIKTAVSNPCFEIWLVLHFDNCSAWLTTDSERRLRHQHDGSTGKEVAGYRYMPLRKDAALRARNLYDMHASNGTSCPHDNPSSGVFRLLEAIKPAVPMSSGRAD